MKILFFLILLLLIVPLASAKILVLTDPDANFNNIEADNYFGGNFYGDDGNFVNVTVSGRLGIGTNTPNAPIEVIDYINFDDATTSVLLGFEAGVTKVGQRNTFIGFRAGRYNNDEGPVSNGGERNVYIGKSTGRGTPTGNQNEAKQTIAIGENALLWNSTGGEHVVIGYEALKNNTTGTRNVAIGAGAMIDNISGQENTAIGWNALPNNTTGERNMSIGYATLGANTTGSFNTSLGFDTLKFNQTGSFNVAIGGFVDGFNAGGMNSHSNVTMLGSFAGYNNQTGSGNVFLGYKAGYNQTTDSNILIIDLGDRGSIGGEIGKSLIYGVFDFDPTAQRLIFNADVNIKSDLNVHGDVNITGTTGLKDQLMLHGDARVERELIFPARNSTKGASAPPTTLRDMGASGGLKEPVVQFSKTTQQDTYGVFHPPSNIDSSEDIEVHLMWVAGDGWTSGNYMWCLEYLVKDEDLSMGTDVNMLLGTPTTICEDVTPTNANSFIETEFSSTIDVNLEQTLSVHFYRDVANDNGDDTGDVRFFEAEYVVNSLGEPI